jgi:AcrR family transcriptional regulator
MAVSTPPSRCPEVSPGTVYSYFETKENILLSMLTLHRESNVQRRLRIVEFPPDDVLEAVVKYERTLLTDATRYLDRKLWRRVTAAGVMQTASKISERSIQIDRVANEERLRMFAVLAERGVISAQFPITRVAEVIRAVSYHVWVKFLRGELRTLAAAQKNVTENVEFVLRGEGAANEREQRAN